MRKLIFLISLFLICFNSAFSQRGKNGDLVVTAATVVNAYTSLSVNAGAGATTLTVANNVLNIPGLGNLAQGDLIMIVQMQGISRYDWGTDSPNISIGLPYVEAPNVPQNTFPVGHESNPYQNGHKFGKIFNYHRAGNYELREVQGVSGSNNIILTCPLENTYEAFGHVQVIRVPRYNNLTINSPGSITAIPWNGSVGGVVAIEVNQNLVLNVVGAINVTGQGFRGGVAAGTSIVGNATPHTQGAGNGDVSLGSPNIASGGEIGESIFGSGSVEYAAEYSRYGRGAIANGGGGGGPQNAGGGGGANVGDTTGHTGKGIPPRGTGNIYDVYWNAEKPNMATTLSSGGGRGGYTYATSSQNPNIGPNKSAWSGNARKENGGYGGHALVYNSSKIFLGGGGGAGGQDSGQGGSGGAGGGIVHLTVYGTISGTGTIEANGGDGQNSNPNNQSTLLNERKGNDGAGGGGGGGYIYVKNSNPIPVSVGLIANGGNGGTHSLRVGSNNGSSELCGPGAGGAGGGIAYTSGTPSTSIIGGSPGGTLYAKGAIGNQNPALGQNPMALQFPMNGATGGGNGLTNLPAPTYDLIAANDTICGSQSATLTVSVTGTLPGGTHVGWYTDQFGGTEIATGTTFNTPVISSTTTYYVGVCPGGTFRKPVTVVVGLNPVISGTANITHADCATGGAISGLTASGGVGTLLYDWNGTETAGPNLSDASAGDYILTVTDANGCSTQSGPHTISGVGGPSISGIANVTNATCITGGSITGLSVSGGTGTLTYTWNGNSYPGPNLPDTVAGSYILIVMDANNCSAQSGPHVIGTTPLPSITGTPIITNENCNNGGSITGLSVTGGVEPYTYSWSGTSSSTIDLLDTLAGIYILTVTDGNGCPVQSASYEIEVDSEPVISGTAAVVDATCITGGSITGLTVSGGVGSYTYQWNSTTTSTINLSDAAPGDYTLTVTDGNNCSAISSTYTIYAPDMPTIDGTAAIVNATCTSPGSITGLTVSGGTTPYSYVWNSSPTLTIDLTGAAAGQYTLTVIDDSDCMVQSGPHTIGTVAPPTLGGTLTIEDATCTQGGSITGITVTGGVEPYSYEWNGNTTLGIDLINVSAGPYTLEVKDANGCVLTSGPHTIASQGAPSITGTATVINATCTTGGSITGLSASGGVGPYTYSWNGNPNPTINISGLQPGTYTLEVEDANGCITTSAPYIIASPSSPVIGGNLVVEDANCVEGGNITGITISGGLAPYTYSWNGGTYSTLNLFNVPVGVYTLTVTDAGQCTTTGSPITVSEDVFVDAQFTYSPNPVLINDPVQFNDASVGNIVSWNWQIDTAQISLQHPTYVFTKDGFYNVKLIVVDANGCIDSITIVIEVISDLEVPNVITANGDGVNDFFVLKGLLPNTKLLILNRWGNLIYTSDNYDNTWNGRDVSGNSVVEGVYTYVVTSPDGNRKQGFVHVVHTP
jgi:gliding motility-associated-like protein